MGSTGKCVVASFSIRTSICITVWANQRCRTDGIREGEKLEINTSVKWMCCYINSDRKMEPVSVLTD